MKKGLLFITAVLLSVASFGQGSATEMGLRLGGDGNGGLGALDVVFPVSRENRVHIDVGVAGPGIAGNCLYDWLFPIKELPELVFYPGIGGGLWVGDGDPNIAVVCELGLEYGFDFPLTVGIDARPRIDLLNDVSPNGGIALIARYRF